MLTEQFKPIKDYEGLYEISNFGTVKSFHGNGRIRKPSMNHKGYLLVLLSKRGTFKSFAIHCLVWDAFGDKPRNGSKLQVDHRDEDKLNNHISNLQLLTDRENLSKGRLLSKKSGLPTGVVWHNKNKIYMAQITINKKHLYLGCYTTIEEASNAYQQKLKEITILEPIEEWNGKSI